MEFNINKCVCLHVGSKNIQAVYKIGSTLLEIVEKERDLGVTIDNSGKVGEQCAAMARRANNVLRQIKRKIRCKSKNVILSLYKSLVRPHLDYCVQVWGPYLKKDTNLIEAVQRRALRLIDNFKYLSYDKRLQKVQMTSLEKRRVRGDLIQVFKLFTGIDKLDYKKFFSINCNRTLRGHQYKIFKDRSRTELRRNCFSQRIVNVWNELPIEVVSAETLDIFKKRVDEWFVNSENNN